MKNEVFIEVEFENGELFRVLESFDGEHFDAGHHLGCWRGDDLTDTSSGAYGYLESLAQSDTYAPFFYGNNFHVVRVEAWDVVVLEGKAADKAEKIIARRTKPEEPRPSASAKHMSSGWICGVEGLVRERGQYVDCKLEPNHEGDHDPHWPGLPVDWPDEERN